MSEKKISVIIPVYKVEKYLKECVESVLNQTYREIEILLVDDGSPDKSPVICDEYAKRDARVKAIHKENGGSSSARNEGLKYATGEYILFLDSDDYWDSDTALQDLMRKTKTDTELVLFRYKKKIEETREVLQPLPELTENELNIPEKKEELLELMMKKGLFIASPCNKLVKKTLLEDNRILFRESVTSEDIEWCAYLLICSKKIQYVNDCFYVYRVRKNSVTMSMSEKNIIDLRDNIIRSIEAGKKELEENSAIYKIFMQYMAYQYATFILCTHNVKEKNMYPIAKEMKRYAGIMRYSKNKKVVAFRLIYRLGGFCFLYYAAGIYMKYLYERI